MAEFLADIAGILEIMAIAAGLVLLHHAAKQGAATLLKVAGWVLIAGGIAVGLCTTSYWFQYRSQGDFDAAYMSSVGMMHHPGMAAGMGMGPGMMRPGTGTMPRPMSPPNDGVPPPAETPEQAR